jgi:uncharacterized membrane protein YqjE
MSASLEKAKQLGVFALERLGEYVELVKVSTEIDGQNLIRRVIGAVVAGFFALLSLTFLGVAVIVTCWDTPYRVMSAWGVAGVYALIAFAIFISAPRRTDSVSALDTLRNELQRDVKLIKEVI